jgi:hypothetical protein
MDDTTAALLASLEQTIQRMKQEIRHYRSVFADMTISRDSQTRVEAAQAIHDGDKIRRGRA